MTVSYEQIGHVGVLRLDDKPRRNALSTAMVTEALDHLRQSRAAGTRAIVIASALRWFCAGADVADMLASGWLEKGGPDPAAPTPPDLFAALEQDDRLVIAAVEGLAIGGGVELLLACDIAVAGADASFALPELALGVIPNTALVKLPRMIGARAAKELILTRRRIDAAEAYRLGLVSRLVSAGGALESALALATETIAACPPAAIAAAKRATSVVDEERSWALLGLMDAAEWREGITAFQEKRKPDYTAAWERRR